MKINKTLVCSFIFLALVIVGLGIQKNSPASPSRINFPIIGGQLPENVNYRLDPSFRLENSKKSASRKATIYENEADFLRINDDGTFVYHNKNRDDNTSMKLYGWNNEKCSD